MTRSATWDDNGDLTDRGSDSFSGDYEDRMVEATVNSVTTTFAYRGDGLRDSRAVIANPGRCSERAEDATVRNLPGERARRARRG